MKTAVLISGELRFIEECLPTQGYINENVDVFVSTWDKVNIQHQYLGINLQEDVTEDRIRALLPNAKMLIEPLDCYKSKKYSDRMIYRWLAGWNMILASGIKYDRIVVTRTDLFFDSDSKFEYDHSVDFEVLWLDSVDSLQDSLFSMSWDFACRFFGTLAVEEWTSSTDFNVHTWMAQVVKRNNPNRIQNIFHPIRCVFYRATHLECLRKPSYENALLRDLDWRDANSISNVIAGRNGKKMDFEPVKKFWSEETVEEMVLTYRSGRLFRKCDNDTLLILAGKTRNFQSLCLSLPIFGDVDVGLVSWNDYESYRISKALRITKKDLTDECHETQRIADVKKSAFHDNVEYMLYHLERAIDMAENSHHENIFITRPDVMLLTNGTLCVPKVGISLLGDSDNAMDLLWVFKRHMIPQFKKFPEKVRQLSASRQSNNIHKMIPLALKELGIKFQRHEQVVNAIIQRDTFQFLLSDVYDRKYFTEVGCDSAAWWRTTFKSPYHLNLNGLI